MSFFADEELLRRAVVNLLMNVLVHTPGGTAEAARALPHGLRIRLTLPVGSPPDPRRAGREQLAVTAS